MTTFGPFTDQPAPMSEEEANAALDAAIRARVRSHHPANYVTGWAVTAVTAIPDAPTTHHSVLYRPNGQPFVLTAGLLHTASFDWTAGRYDGEDDE